MRKSLIIALVVMALGACRYESTADLRSSARVYSPTGAFDVGQHVFQTRDQSRLLDLRVTKSAARANFQDQGSMPLTASLVAVLGSDSFPEKTYVAMALAGKDDKGRPKHHYYPFSFGKKHVEWYKPAKEATVFGLADLADHVAAEKARGGMMLSLVPKGQQAEVLARFAEWHERAKQKNTQPPAAVAAPAPPAAPSVRGLTIGDGVYVQGLFRDSPSIIQDIDTATGRVKVKRYEDGVSEWVPAGSIISRGESTANDVARTGAAVGLMVCLFSPETCKPKQ